jgi:hypothetical protein
MKALVGFFAALLFAGAAASAVAQQANPAASPPAPQAPETAPKIASTALPSDAQDAAVKLAYETLSPCMVTVRIKVREEREATYEQRAPLEAMFDQIVRERVPLLVSGVRVNPDGLVLIRDPNLPLKRYEEITATDPAGAVTPMRNRVRPKRVALRARGSASKPARIRDVNDPGTKWMESPMAIRKTTKGLTRVEGFPILPKL